MQGRSAAAFRIEHIVTMAPFTYCHCPLPIANTTLPYYTVATNIVTSPVVDPSIAVADSIVRDWATAIACNTFIDRSCC